MNEVRARRMAGGEYQLSAGEGGAVWTVRRYGYRAGGLAPYWYEDGLDWHLWKGGAQSDGPPVRSFGSMAEVKDYVARQAAQEGR